MGHVERLNPEELQIQIMRGAINESGKIHSKVKLYEYQHNIKQRLADFGLDQVNAQRVIHNRPNGEMK